MLAASPLVRDFALLWALCLLLATPGASRGEPRSDAIWRWLPDRGTGEGVTAVATDPARGTLAFGTAVGVWVRRATGATGGRELGLFRRAARTGRVNDMQFDADGTLWIAADDGLWQLGPGAEADAARRHSPAPGPRARRASRVAVAPGAVVVATDLGAYAAPTAAGHALRFRAVDAEVPSGAVSALALRRGPDLGGSLSVFVAVGSRVWRARLVLREGELRTEEARRELVATPRAGEEPVDLVTDERDGSLVVVYPRAVAVQRRPGTPFELQRPALPPGARARRLVPAEGRSFLVTDRGVLEAARLEGPWRRSGPPAGSAPAYALAAAGRDVYVATASGLLAASFPPAGAPVAAKGPAAPLPDASSRGTSGPSPDRLARFGPDILAVQRAALRYLALEPERVRRMRDGVAVRGYLPELDLRFGSFRRRFVRDEYDQSFTSGATRHLYDHDRDRQRDLEYGVALRWDFRDAAFDPEMVDVSREAREVIELRDDVLDEINQLYYERVRILSDLAARPEAPPADPAEVRRLRIRAAELAAGLDAWTGGWFGAHQGARPDHGHDGDDTPVPHTGRSDP